MFLNQDLWISQNAKFSAKIKIFKFGTKKIFVLFSSPDHEDKFREYLSSKHPNIKFSIEKEEDGCLPFLDINISREDDKFAITSIKKRPSVGFIPTSKVLYLKHIKLV